jgi:outer membrane protein TolC
LDVHGCFLGPDLGDPFFLFQQDIQKGNLSQVRTFLILLFSFFPAFLFAEELLTWEDCIAQALKNHPDLISANESIKQSQAAKAVTASTLLPQITAGMAGSTQDAAGETGDSYSYGVSGSQLLFDGGKTMSDVRAAQENIKASQFNYRFTSSDVRQRLRTAYINLLKDQESLKLTQEIYDIRRGNLELITLRYESGMEHWGALLTAQANLGQAQFEIAQAKRGLEVSQRQLIKEMGRKKFSPVAVDGDFTVRETVTTKPDLDALVETNPSLLALLTRINQANFSLKSAYRDFFPTLSAQAGAGRNGGNWPPQDNLWDAGLSLNLPLFEGGLKQARLAEAGSVLNQSKADEQSGRDALVLALEQTWALLQDALETVSVQKKFLEAAQIRAKIAEAQYSTGFISYDNWTIIQDDFVGAKKSFLNAQANALQAEANWIQAKGETLEYASQ